MCTSVQYQVTCTGSAHGQGTCPLSAIPARGWVDLTMGTSFQGLADHSHPVSWRRVHGYRVKLDLNWCRGWVALAPIGHNTQKPFKLGHWLLVLLTLLLVLLHSRVMDNVFGNCAFHFLQHSLSCSLGLLFLFLHLPLDLLPKF